jgi:tetratricopeptide (TPR) repeat protein
VWQRHISVSYNKIGDVLIAQGKLQDALRAYRESIAIFERLAKADPSNTDRQRDLAVSYEKVGDALVAQGKLPEALNAYRDGLAIKERMAKADPSNILWQVDLTDSYNNVGDVLVAQRNLPDALRAYSDSLTIRERLAKADPSRAEWQHQLAASYARVGDVMVAKGNLKDALKAYRDCVAIAERLTKSDPSNMDWQRSLSYSYSRAGDVVVAQGNLHDAMKAHRDSFAIAERLAKADPGNSGWQRDLAASHSKLGGLHAQRGDYKAATSELRAALAVLDGMHDRGMHLDPEASQFRSQLSEQIAQLQATAPGAFQPTVLAAQGQTPFTPAIGNVATPKPADAVGDFVARARAMVAANDIAGAATLLAQAPTSPGLPHARAVCALRLGQPQEAALLIQPAVLPDGVHVPPDITPDAWIVTYATALALADDPRGAEHALGWVRNTRHRGAKALRHSLEAWHKSLSWREAASYRLGGKPPRPLTLDFVPGEF